MVKTDIDKIKGAFYVYSNGEYVVLPGTKLYLFKTDGSMVACRTDLRYAGRITFLSGNRMLLCSSKAVFHMIDLRDGSDIWTTPYLKNELNVHKLAVSPDEAFVYTYDGWKGCNFISRLDLQNLTVEDYDMRWDVGATTDILCDEEGIPCLLKTVQETIGGKFFCQNGVRIHDFDCVNPGGTNVWKTKWSFEFPRNALRYFDSTEKIITNDLCIYDTATGASVDLLENESTWEPPGNDLCDCWLDNSKHYLCLQYQTANAIIDIRARKVVAQYAADYKKGCLIGNEYWLCVGNKILRKPFPAFEEAPPVKRIGWDEFYAQQPQRR